MICLYLLTVNCLSFVVIMSWLNPFSFAQWSGFKVALCVVRFRWTFCIHMLIYECFQEQIPSRAEWIHPGWMNLWHQPSWDFLELRNIPWDCSLAKQWQLENLRVADIVLWCHCVGEGKTTVVKSTNEVHSTVKRSNISVVKIVPALHADGSE